MRTLVLSAIGPVSFDACCRETVTESSWNRSFLIRRFNADRISLESLAYLRSQPMSISQSLLPEFNHEMANTRKVESRQALSRKGEEVGK